LAVADGYAYVADLTSLYVINVNNPGNPSIVTSLATGAIDLALTGNRLYVIGNNQLKIIDVSTPSNPQVLSTSSSYYAQGVGAAGSVVFLVTPVVDSQTNATGLFVIDASLPSTPELQANTYGGFQNYDVAANGSLATVTGDFGIKIVDISDPYTPEVLGAIAPEGTGGLSSVMQGVAMSGQYAYFLEYVPGNPGTYYFRVANVDVPANPTVVGELPLSGTAYRVEVVGSLAYVAGSPGLLIVDVSNPSNPSIVGSAYTSGSSKVLAVADGYAYVADLASLYVINVSNPGNPSIVTSLATGAIDLALTGNRLYVIGDNQLKIIDVSTPSNPQVLSTSSSYYAQGVGAAGSLAFLVTPYVDSGSGVHVLDVTNPAQPALLETLRAPGSSRSLAASASGDFLYAGDGDAFIDVFQLSPPQ
jgi:hypothetical protein